MTESPLSSRRSNSRPRRRNSRHRRARSWKRSCATGSDAADAGPSPIVQLLGADPISKQLVALHAAAKLNRNLYRLPVELLPAAPTDLETLARLWQRESRLLPLALYLDAEEVDAAAAGRSGTLTRFVARNDGLCFIDVREAMPRLGRNHIALDVAKPTPAEQQSAWTEELGADAADSPALLAAQFNLNLPNVRSLAQLAKAEAEGGHSRCREGLGHLPCQRTPATGCACATVGAEGDMGRSCLA